MPIDTYKPWHDYNKTRYIIPQARKFLKTTNTAYTKTMPGMNFKAKTTDLETLAKQFSRVAPRETQWALARTLSNLAFRTRAHSIDVIDAHLTIRNRSFVKASLKFRKANHREPINRMAAFAGSIALERATGWVEQQHAGTDERKRIFAGKGRTKGGRGVAKKKYRFTPDKEIPDNIDGFGSDDYMGMANGDAARAAVIMTAMLKRAGYIDKPFAVRNAHINEGVYVMTPGGKLRWVATVEQKHKVKQVRWIDEAFNKALREKPVSITFHRELRNGLDRSFAQRLKRRGLR